MRLGPQSRGCRGLIAAVAIAGALVRPLRAEEPARLGEVVVTAPRITEEKKLRDRTAFATVVDTRGKPAEVDTVAQVLAETVGAQVRRFGGVGAFSTLSLRGYSPGQVQIYLDGVPLSRARNEVVNLSTVPLDSIDHIEVYRGSSPIAFGASAPGGVVNIVPRRAGAMPVTSIAASYGSFDTRKVDFHRSARIGAWEYLLFATYLGSSGAFSFRDDNGTPDNPFDDRDVRRRNNGFNSGDLTARVGYRFDGGAEIEALDQAFLRREGIPGLANVQARKAHLSTLRNVFHLRTKLPAFALRNLDLEAGAYHVYERQRFVDRRGEIGPGRRDLDQQTGVEGVQALATYYLGSHQILALSLAGSDESFSATDSLSGGSTEFGRLRFTAAGEDEVVLLGEKVVLVPAVRYELVADRAAGDAGIEPGAVPRRTVRRGFVSPKIGLRVRPWAWLTLRANVGRYARVPNLGERFGQRGSLVGNPALRPEIALNRDAGFGLSWERLGPLRRLSIGYGYFDNEVDDLIVVVQTAGRRLLPLNISSARLRGHEVSVGFDLAHFAFSLNYTDQDNIDTGRIPFRRGRQLPGRPGRELYLRAEVFGGPLRLAYEVNLVAENFLDQPNLRRVPARTIHDLGLTISPWGSRLKIHLDLKNLTDNRIADVAGFPLPGRSFFATVEARR